MLELPVFQEVAAESERTGRVKSIIEFLEARLATITPTIKAGLEQIKEPDKLSRLTRYAALCDSLAAFETELLKELPPPQPPSTRGKRRSGKKST